MDTRTYWEDVHAESDADDVSWWQDRPRTSLRLFERAGVSPSARVLDVGCGQHGIAPALLEAGYSHLSAMDISPAAISKAQKKMRGDAARVEWIEADVRTFAPSVRFDVWHDRAVFHFLTAPADQRAYAEALRRAVRPGGHVIIATFAPDGPEQCSGLPVARYDPEGIARTLGLELLHGERETHVTPWGTEQRFAWALLGA